MKPQYKRQIPKWEFNARKGELELYCWGEGRYSLEYAWYRYVRTTNEIRANAAALEDGYKVRGRRRNLPTVYDDVRVSRTWGRSWKDYTKRRKQYHGT